MFMDSKRSRDENTTSWFQYSMNLYKNIINIEHMFKDFGS